MSKAFTLIELLVVIGIMGLLGTVSVGGYRAMQRGMEERAVMQNVDSLVTLAFERAQIDRLPTALYFWNETIASATEESDEIVVGKAVAVRFGGRLSQITSDLLIDEFADLNLSYPDNTDEEDDDGESGKGGQGASATDAGDNTMYLYCLDDLNDVKRSVVGSIARSRTYPETYLNGEPQDTDKGRLTVWGFDRSPDKGGGGKPDWKTGSAYGIEFAEITLPHGFIFGSDYSKNVENPVTEAGTMAFSVGISKGDGVQNFNVYGDVIISSLRPNASGALTAEKVGTVKKPN